MPLWGYIMFVENLGKTVVSFSWRGLFSISFSIQKASLGKTCVGLLSFSLPLFDLFRLWGLLIVRAFEKRLGKTLNFKICSLEGFYQYMHILIFISLSFLSLCLLHPFINRLNTHHMLQNEELSCLLQWRDNLYHTWCGGNSFLMNFRCCASSFVKIKTNF